jgi:hypothetical protein
MREGTTTRTRTTFPRHVLRLHNLRHGLAEDLIDNLVVGVKALVVFGVRREVVKQRPDCLVAEAVIELVHRPFGEKYGMGVEFCEHGGRGRLFCGLLDRDARPADPPVFGLREGRALQGVEVGADARDEAAGALVELHLAVFLDSHDGQSV